MANESAGTISVELRAKLDSLTADVNKANNAIRGIEDQTKKTNTLTTNSFSKTGEEIGKSITKLSNSSVNQFAKMANGISNAFKALPIIGAVTMIAGAVAKLVGGISDYLNKTADAYFRQQKELTTLNAIIQTTGASAWTSSAQLNSMAAALSKATGYATNDITKMQGRILTYTNIVGDNFKRTSKAAIDMAAVMGMDLASAAETLGKALDSPTEGLNTLTRQGFRFKDDLKEQITLLVEHGDIAKAQALILNEVESVYQGVASAQSSVSSKTERLKQVQEELNAEVGRTTSGFTNFVAGIKLSWKESLLFEMRQKRIGEAAKNSEAKINQYSKSITDLKKELDELIANGANDERLIQIRVQIQNAESNLDKEKENEAAVQARIDNSERILEQYSTTYRHIAEMQMERNKIHQQMLDAEKELETATGRRAEDLRFNIDLVKNLIESTNQEIRQKQEELRIHEEEYRIALQDMEAIKERQRIEEINLEIERKIAADKLALKPLEDAVTAATERRRLAILAAGVAESNGRITSEEYHRQVMNAYTEEANQLTMLGQQIHEVGLTSAQAAELRREAENKTTAALNQSIALEQQRRNMLADIAMNNVYKDLQDEFYRLMATEEQLIELERKRAWEAIENSDDYKNATEDVRIAVRKVFDEITNLKNATKEEDPNEYWNKLKNKVSEYGSAIDSVISNFASLHGAFIKKSVDEEINALNKLYKIQLEYLEKEKQAKLYAKGFIEAQTEEQHQRELELAIESGDQQRIYAAHDAHERWLIEDEFAKNKEALDEETARKKAELEYKSALASWQSQLLQAITSAALATAGTLGSPPYPPANLGLVAMSAAAGAAQVGIISANKPKMQAFTEGGIVPGNSFRGDNILARVNSDEVIFNKRQQKNLFNAVDKNELGGEQTIVIHNHLYVDGKEMARNTVTHINNRSAGLIKEGSIVK